MTCSRDGVCPSGAQPATTVSQASRPVPRAGVDEQLGRADAGDRAGEMRSAPPARPRPRSPRRGAQRQRRGQADRRAGVAAVGLGVHDEVTAVDPQAVVGAGVAHVRRAVGVDLGAATRCSASPLRRPHRTQVLAQAPAPLLATGETEPASGAADADADDNPVSSAPARTATLPTARDLLTTSS